MGLLYVNPEVRHGDGIIIKKALRKAITTVREWKEYLMFSFEVADFVCVSQIIISLLFCNEY